MIDERMRQIERNLADVYNGIEQAALACGRDPAEITLIGVSKHFPPDYAAAAYRLGLQHLGENRVQEMNEKIDYLAAGGLQPYWHLIGTLQTNKVKAIIGRTCLIHSVDREALLMEISRRSTHYGVKTEILLQVNISNEKSKHGFQAQFVREKIQEWSRLPGVVLRGLMTMAPLEAAEDELREIFSQTGSLQRELSRQILPEDRFSILSMGMSQDYPIAIACGATHIRIGTAIFGRRQD